MTPFAFAPNGDCSTCHGFPPVKNMAGLGTFGNYTNAKFQDYSGGGGAHTVAGHIPKTINKSVGSSACTSCHADFANSHNQGSTPVKKSFVNVVVDTKYKFNNTTSIVYNANTCSNVSCHFKPSPNWVTGN
jgi:heterodisulfide reductase subunit A-like polyferredoxin